MVYKIITNPLKTGNPYSGTFAKSLTHPYAVFALFTVTNKYIFIEKIQYILEIVTCNSSIYARIYTELQKKPISFVCLIFLLFVIE